MDYIQIDASSTAVTQADLFFNNVGEVIGVNTAIFSPNGGSVGIGFAIPASVAKNVIHQLREDGRVARAWLGVEIQPVTTEIAKSLSMDNATGALVSRITPDSPAAGSHLETGDVIIGFNGRPVENIRELPRMVAKAPVGTSATVKVFRDGAELTIDAVLASIPETGQTRQVAAPTPVEGSPGSAPGAPERRDAHRARPSG